MAFEDSDDGGISVIDHDCIIKSGRNVCSHIAKYYSPAVAGNPPFFWRVQSHAFPKVVEIVQKDSDTGDRCHQELFKYPRNQRRKVMPGLTIAQFEVCDGFESRTLTLRDIEIQHPPPST